MKSSMKSLAISIIVKERAQGPRLSDTQKYIGVEIALWAKNLYRKGTITERL